MALSNKTSLRVMTAAIVVIYFIVFLVFGYVDMVLIFAALAIIGAVALTAARFVVVSSSVTLRGVGVGYALATAAHALWVVDDFRLGFPSGTFLISEGHDPNALVASEFKPKSVGGAMLMTIFLIPWRITGAIVRTVASIADSGLVYLIAQAIRICLMAFALFLFIVPLLLAWVLEGVLKPVVASEIRVTAESAQDAALLHFTFRGASALMVRPTLMSAFAAPALPCRYASLGGRA